MYHQKNKILSYLGLYPSIFNNDFSQHITAGQLMGELPESIFQNYFKFGFVRNPWDWQVSLDNFALQTPHHHQHELIKSMKSFD